MSFNSSSGTVNITGQVTATPGTHNTRVLLPSGTVTNQTVTMGTVPASKTWRIISASLCIQAGTETAASISLNGVHLLDGSMYATATNSVWTSVVFPYDVAPTIAATQTITCTCGLNGKAWANIVYIEE